MLIKPWHVAYEEKEGELSSILTANIIGKSNYIFIIIMKNLVF